MQRFQIARVFYSTGMVGSPLAWRMEKVLDMAAEESAEGQPPQQQKLCMQTVPPAVICGPAYTTRGTQMATRSTSTFATDYGFLLPTEKKD